MNLMAVPASFVVPWLSDRLGRRQPFLFVLSLNFVLTAFLLVLVPGGAFAWGAMLGISQGGMFTLSLMLPLDFEDRIERAGALVAIQLGVGYTIGAASPFVLGGIRDLTGSFRGVLWAVVGILGLLAVCVALLPRARRAHARSLAV